MLISCDHKLSDKVAAIFVDGHPWDMRKFPVHSLRTGSVGVGWIKHYVTLDNDIVCDESGRPLIAHRKGRVLVRFSDESANRKMMLQCLAESEQIYAELNERHVTAIKNCMPESTIRLTGEAANFAMGYIRQLEKYLSRPAQ